MLVGGNTVIIVCYVAYARGYGICLNQGGSHSQLLLPPSIHQSRHRLLLLHLQGHYPGCRLPSPDSQLQLSAAAAALRSSLLAQSDTHCIDVMPSYVPAAYIQPLPVSLCDCRCHVATLSFTLLSGSVP